MPTRFKFSRILAATLGMLACTTFIENAFVDRLFVRSAVAQEEQDSAASENTAKENTAKKIAFFEQRIRPALIEHCYECHAADSDEIGGGLRVDSAAGLLRGGDSGPAIIAGKPEGSSLIEAIRYEGFEMPPSGRLPENVVQDFESWVADGAMDPRESEPDAKTKPAQRVIDIEQGKQFWSFQPLKQVLPPGVTEQQWPRTDIDRFVLARLEQNGLAPAPDAARETMVRRLYFDLTGLPPSPEELQAAVEDRSAAWLESLVDQLLESPQFGVHWGRHWLDVARYADSNGSDFNATHHDAWKYRDYVIDSFNSDKRFDQFVREQIAGDLLPVESDDQRAEGIIATGFLMVGAKMLSERDKEKLTMDVVDEQLNTVGQALMGMTLGCARCHDHKFDPIPTSDYYAMAGIFRSTRTLEGESQEYVSTWPRRQLPVAPEKLTAIKEHEQQQTALRDQIAKHKTRREEIDIAILSLREGVVVADDSQAKLTGEWTPSTYSPDFVGAGYVHDGQAEKGEKYAEFSLTVAESGSYDLQYAYTAAGNRAKAVPISIRHADEEHQVSLDQTKKPTIEKKFASLGRYEVDASSPFQVTVSTGDTKGYVIVDAIRLVPIENDVDENEEDQSDDENAVVNEELNELRKQLADMKQAIEAAEAKLKELNQNAPAPIPTAFAVAEATEIGDCNICVRGEHDNPGPVARRGFLQVASDGRSESFSQQESGRRELADWIAQAEHPLTARVYVNRVWHHLLGRGIVASVDNFGELGDRPTHPELLDWLATEFIRGDWSTKRLVRQIVSSRIYSASNRHNEVAWQADPDNALLWRAHRKRITAESLRDAMLAVGGRLDLNPVGSPVEGLGVLVTQNTSEQKQFKREQSANRTVYQPVIRGEIDSLLAVFDFADPDLVTGRRARTNVPAQALMLLNSPFVMEQTELAANSIREAVSQQNDTGDGSTALIRRAYQLVLSREATQVELKRAARFISERASPATSDDESGRSDPLAELIHTLMASTEFRMLN